MPTDVGQVRNLLEPLFPDLSERYHCPSQGLSTFLWPLLHDSSWPVSDLQAVSITVYSNFAAVMLQMS